MHHMKVTILAVALALAPVVAMAAQPQSFSGWKNDVLSLPPFPADQPQAFCVQNAVCVASDGNVTVQPGVKLTLAAKQFWNAVAQVQRQPLPFPEIAR